MTMTRRREKISEALPSAPIGCFFESADTCAGGPGLDDRERRREELEAKERQREAAQAAAFFGDVTLDASAARSAVDRLAYTHAAAKEQKVRRPCGLLSRGSSLFSSSHVSSFCLPSRPPLHTCSSHLFFIHVLLPFILLLLSSLLSTPSLGTSAGGPRGAAAGRGGGQAEGLFRGEGHPQGRRRRGCLQPALRRRKKAQGKAHEPIHTPRFRKVPCPVSCSRFLGEQPTTTSA